MTQNEYLIHYGVQGMKWGRRKSKPSSGKKKTSTTKKSTSSNKKSVKQRAKEVISKVDKEKVKKIAKTTAIVAGSIAATAALGYAGSIAVSELSKIDWSNAISNKTTHTFEYENYSTGQKTTKTYTNDDLYKKR